MKISIILVALFLASCQKETVQIPSSNIIGFDELTGTAKEVTDRVWGDTISYNDKTIIFGDTISFTNQTIVGGPIESFKVERAAPYITSEIDIAPGEGAMFTGGAYKVTVVQPLPPYAAKLHISCYINGNRVANFAY